MHAIILSPGPSLARYVPQPCDLTLGVNRAARLFPCDVWVCGDTPLIELPDLVDGKPLHESIIGSPLLVTYGVTMDTLRDHGFKWRGEIFSWTQIAESFWLHTSVVNWPWCTCTAAVVYAAFAGAKSIDVYGADWEGVEDFDGAKAGKNRSVDRWREERSIFGALQIVLKEKRGVTIRRMNDGV